MITVKYKEAVMKPLRIAIQWVYKWHQAAQYLMLTLHILGVKKLLPPVHSMANIKVVGRMETAQKAGLYLTVKDYSNPGPNGGLVLDNAQPDNQSYAFVTAPNFPQGQMMLVTYPRIDYKLRMSDRKSASHPPRRIIALKMER